MVCASCRAVLPDAARFCAACGSPAGSDALTMGASQPTELSPGGFTGRTPSAAGKLPASGWLTSSDSISHGRFGPGSLLDSRYRIIGLLGRGGMGEVYRADDLRLGQPVALKLLPETLRHDPVRRAQFHTEVRTARHVSHPNVCRVYDIGEADGLLYLSMEYVDGEDLASSIITVLFAITFGYSAERDSWRKRTCAADEETSRARRVLASAWPPS
jgi:hypothetical protein